MCWNCLVAQLWFGEEHSGSKFWLGCSYDRQLHHRMRQIFAVRIVLPSIAICTEYVVPLDWLSLRSHQKWHETRLNMPSDWRHNYVMATVQGQCQRCTLVSICLFSSLLGARSLVQSQDIQMCVSPSFLLYHFSGKSSRLECKVSKFMLHLLLLLHMARGVGILLQAFWQACMISTLAWYCRSHIGFSAFSFWWWALTPQYDIPWF